jgi:polyisoprenoid-binding protein YceI
LTFESERIVGTREAFTIEGKLTIHGVIER